jgi:heptosyltransferase-2
MRMLGINARIGFPMNETNYYAHTIAWRARQLSRGRFLERALEWLPGPLLTTPLTRKSYEQHHLDDWGQVASALGLSYSIQPPWVHVEPVEKGYWLLHPGGRLPSKRWPTERFQAVVDGYFAKHTLPLVIVHPPEGLEIAARHPLHKVVKPATILELWRWIAGARGVLCNDSLAAHLAASCGKPVLAIFGSANPNWFSPGNDPGSVIESRVCPHRPCLDECQRPRFECLEAVTVTQVIEQCEKQFGSAVSADSAI